MRVSSLLFLLFALLAVAFINAEDAAPAAAAEGAAPAAGGDAAAGEEASGEEGDFDEEDDEDEDYDDEEGEDDDEDDEVDLVHEEEFFKQSDTNKDGTLDFDEFKALLKEEGEPDLSEAEAQEAFKEHDTDNDGKITLDEWKKFFFHEDPQDAEYVDGVDQNALAALEEKPFADLDANKDGHITNDELVKTLEELKAKDNKGEGSTEIDADTKKGLEELVKSVDKNGDGKLSEDEWKSLAHSE